MFNTVRGVCRMIVYRTAVPLLGAAMVMGVAGCDDDEDDEIIVPVVTAVVTTFVDEAFNFSTLRTFAMPDTVIHFAPLTGTPLPVSREFDRTILDRVRQDLLSRGYTVAANPQTVAPDFVVLVGTTATQNYQAWVSYPWYVNWGFYSGLGWYTTGFNESWGIVYPWAPVAGVTSYDRGTLIVDLIPTLTVQPVNKTIRSAWAGAATGLMNGQLTSDKVTAAIDEMFRQSPYLTAPAPAQIPSGAMP